MNGRDLILPFISEFRFLYLTTQCLEDDVDSNFGCCRLRRRFHSINQGKKFKQKKPIDDHWDGKRQLLKRMWLESVSSSMQQTKLPDFDINKQNLNVQTHSAAFAHAGTTDIFCPTYHWKLTMWNPNGRSVRPLVLFIQKSMSSLLCKSILPTWFKKAQNLCLNISAWD